MHLPDAWGYVLFADEQGHVPGSAAEGPAKSWRDPAWPHRSAALGFYYSARVFRDREGRYPQSLDELEGLVDQTLLDSFSFSFIPQDPATGYCVVVTQGWWKVTLDHNRLLRVEEIN